WARVAARLEHAARLFVRIRVAELRDAEGVREVVRAAIEVGIEMDRARSLVDIVAAVLAPEDAQPRREQRLRDEIEVDAGDERNVPRGGGDRKRRRDSMRHDHGLEQLARAACKVRD